jgi:LemA protein
MLSRILIIALISLLSVTVIAMATIVTRLIAKRKQVVKGYGTIDVQLKRRQELVEEMAEIAKTKKEPFAEIVNKFVFLKDRAQSVNSPIEREHFENALTCCLSEFFDSTKGRQEYCGCPKFAELWANLQQIDDDLRRSTSFYNDVTDQFNQAVDGVPARFIAPIFSIERQPLFHFDAAQTASALPKPHLGDKPTGAVKPGADSATA